jgi:hypothetical protein
MRPSVRLVLLLGALAPALLAACGSAPPAGGAPPPQPSAAPPVPAQMSRADFQRALDTGRFRLLKLEQIGELVPIGMAGGPTPPTPAPGTGHGFDCMPGGSSTLWILEPATGRLLKVDQAHRLHAPPNVSIPATRCFQRTVKLPAGATVSGSFTVSAD